jgi:hypothetical protein
MALDAITSLMAFFAIMPAELVYRERIQFPDGALVEMVIWLVPKPVPPSDHLYKYSLAYVVSGRRLLGYDNERGKGDHRHFGESEEPVSFSTMRELVGRFIAEVEALRGEPP